MVIPVCKYRYSGHPYIPQEESMLGLPLVARWVKSPPSTFCRFLLLALALFGGLLASTSPAPAQNPLREMNYYAKDYAWDAFWNNWNTGTKSEMTADLPRITALGCNTVRIFIDAPVFGYPTPSSTMMANFDDCLNLLNSYGLKAHVTLFDCWGNWSDISGSQTWCADVVGPHANDSRVAVWELHNELDMSNTSVQNWYKALYPYMKSKAGTNLCTVSVVNVNDLATVKSLAVPDIYTWHYYTSYFYWTNNLQGDINTAKATVGSARLLIGETGQNSYDVSEQTQYDFYRDVFYRFAANGISEIGIWTLWDFPIGTKQCGGYVPPISQDFFGLYRADGSTKPAYQLVYNEFHGSPPSSPTPSLVTNPSFEDVNANNGNVLYNWLSWSSNGSTATFARDTTVHNAGSASVKITSTPGISVGIWNEPNIPVSAGQVYSLYGYARTQNLSGWAHLTLSWFDGGAHWLGDSTGPQLTTGNQSTFTSLAFSATAPTNAAYVKIYCEMYSSVASSYVWFDDVTFNGQPDLIVTSTSWSPGSPINGDHVVFTATVKNQGSAPTPNGTTVGVSFLIDGSQVSWSGDSTGLDAGASITLQANGGPLGVNYWTATAGSHSFQAFADDVNRIAESNEGNNTLTTTLNVPPAIPTGLVASPGNTTAALTWNSAAGATSYNIKRSTTTGGPYTVIKTGNTTNSYTDTGLTNGTTYYYVVSAVNSGVESANSAQVSMISLPDLVVTSFTWSPTSPVAGSHVVFTAVVKNQGTAPTPAGMEIGVGFYIDSRDVTWEGHDTTSLAPGASVTLTADGGPSGVNYWVATSGSHTAKAWVDDAGRIAESNENNNTLSKTLSVP